MSRYENEDGVVTEASDGVVAYLAQVTPDQEREVGVGPWQGPWPEGDHWDHELLEHGDRRNVVDPYRYWKWEAIKADMASRAHGLHIAIENVSHDLNIGSIVRTANAFNVGGVHVVGKRRWNRRGAMVTDRYLRVYHHPTPEHLVRWAQENNLELLAIDNGPGSELIEKPHCRLTPCWWWAVKAKVSARPYLSTANASYVLANTVLPGPLMFQRQQLSLCIPGSCNMDKVHPFN